MLLSKEDMFGNKVADGAVGTPVVFPNTMDWRNHGEDIYFRLFLCVQCMTAAASGGASTVSFTWETSDDETNWTAIQVFGSFGLSELTKGAFLVKNSALPRGLKRYQRLKATTAGAAFTTAPEFFAFLVDGREEPLS